jgi:hypothetical protein
MGKFVGFNDPLYIVIGNILLIPANNGMEVSRWRSVMKAVGYAFICSGLTGSQGSTFCRKGLVLHPGRIRNGKWWVL